MADRAKERMVSTLKRGKAAPAVENFHSGPGPKTRDKIGKFAGSPAYQMLPRSARRVFAAIERAIGNGSSASVSYTEFQLDHHIGRQNISVSLKLLHGVGLIEVEPGPRLTNIFRLSNRWRTIDEVEVARLSELAREPQPGRRFEKRREPKPVTAAPSPKPMTVERRMLRAMPSLPTSPWADDGR
jgi:hypothetical protein